VEAITFWIEEETHAVRKRWKYSFQASFTHKNNSETQTNHNERRCRPIDHTCKNMICMYYPFQFISGTSYKNNNIGANLSNTSMIYYIKEQWVSKLVPVPSSLSFIRIYRYRKWARIFIGATLASRLIVCASLIIAIGFTDFCWKNTKKVYLSDTEVVQIAIKWKRMRRTGLPYINKSLTKLSRLKWTLAREAIGSGHNE
jgi:hypothetical protein